MTDIHQPSAIGHQLSATSHQPSAMLPCDTVLVAAAYRLALGEARKAKERWIKPFGLLACHQIGHHRADGGGGLESVAPVPGGDEEPAAGRRLVGHGVPVGGGAGG